MSRSRRYLVSVVGLAALVLAACQPADLPAPAPTGTHIPVDQPVPTGTHIPVDRPVPTGTPAPADTAVPDPATACPQPGPDQTLYLSRENGFCFVYPADFKAQPDFTRPQAAVTLLGPAEIAGMEGIATTLTVAYNGPADGLDSQAYATKWKSLFIYGDETAPEAVTVGGQPAFLLRNVPGGYAAQQTALVAAGGSKYQVTAFPQPADSAKLAEHVQRVWDAVTGSLVFFPPAQSEPVVRAADVCPEAAADTQLWVNETGGFCVLYPAGYQLDPEFAGRIFGGPVLAETTDWGKVQTSITIATYDQPPSALEQVLTPPTEQIDPASVQQVTMGGVPAVLYDFTGGPWRQRTASLAARGSQYTMVGPWDGEHFPGSEAEAQRLWDTVTGSIAFFDKWR